MILILPNVDLAKLQPQIAAVLPVAMLVYAQFAGDLVVTSVCDGTHREGSFHYAGLAADFRVKHLPIAVWPAVRARLAEALGPQYDVLLETDPAKPHVHVEYDPQKRNRI